MPSVDANRCKIHGLGAGPDGRCVLCRRESAAADKALAAWTGGAGRPRDAAAKTKSALAVIVPLATLVGVGVTLFWLWGGFSQKRGADGKPAPKARSPSAADEEDDEDGDDPKLEDKKRRLRTRLARERETAEMQARLQAIAQARGVRVRRGHPPRTLVKALERQFAEQATARRQAQAQAQAERELKQAAVRAAEKQVAVTVYMADW